MICADAELLANETLDMTGLRSLQLQRLQDSVTRIWNGNPAYRQKCEVAGVTPSDLVCVEDLARFPFTAKSDLRDNYPFGFFSVPMESIARIHASSGTTGKPTVVGYTLDDVQTWAGLVARSIHAAGGMPGMKVHVAYGYGLFTGGLGAHYGAEALGCTVIPMSGGNTEKQIQLIQDFRPDIIMATPSYMLTLIDEMRCRGIDPSCTSLKIGIFGAEPWTDAMRREIERAADLVAVDIYGLSEVMGPGVAQEYAETQDGLTIWEDHFYPEIVDPQTGEPLPEGATGELVFTSLTKQAMPIIRYRTGDLTRLLPGSVGPMRRMAKVSGRTDDMLIIRGVNVFPGQIEEQILRVGAFSPHYEIEVKREGRLDILTVKVECQEQHPQSSLTVAQGELAARVKSITGVSARVEICPRGSLRRFEGKAARVVDLRSSTEGNACL